MNAPLSIEYWQDLRYLAEPFELMKFTLIYDGDLPSGGNKPKPEYAALIRNTLHPQLADLWNRDIILRTLARTARTIPNPGAGYFASSKPIWSPVRLPEFDGPIPPLLPDQVDFCAPISVPELGNFVPLVRESLYLACDLDITFLRHDHDLKVLKKGGDLDNRIKTLFDGLKMPSDVGQQGGIEPTANPLYTLLEDDARIHSFTLRTGTLLGESLQNEKRVRINVGVTIKVLRVFSQNQCLIGG
jgi:hypothetical protein